MRGVIKNLQGGGIYTARGCPCQPLPRGELSDTPAA
jgi:hypothetical protein